MISSGGLPHKGEGGVTVDATPPTPGAGLHSPVSGSRGNRCGCAPPSPHIKAPQPCSGTGDDSSRPLTAARSKRLSYRMVRVAQAKRPGLNHLQGGQKQAYRWERTNHSSSLCCGSSVAVWFSVQTTVTLFLPNWLYNYHTLPSRGRNSYKMVQLDQGTPEEKLVLSFWNPCPARNNNLEENREHNKSCCRKRGIEGGVFLPLWIFQGGLGLT